MGSEKSLRWIAMRYFKEVWKERGRINIYKVYDNGRFDWWEHGKWETAEHCTDWIGATGVRSSPWVYTEMTKEEVFIELL